MNVYKKERNVKLAEDSVIKCLGKMIEMYMDWCCGVNMRMRYKYIW